MNANEAMAQHFVTQFLAPWSLLHLLQLLYFLLSSPFALGRFFCPLLNGVQLMATFMRVSA